MLYLRGLELVEHVGTGPTEPVGASAFAEATADKTADKLRESSGWNRLRRGFGLR